MKKLLLVSLIGLQIMGCASGVKRIDTDIDAKGNSNDGVIGLKDGSVVIQKADNADAELRGQQWQNYELEHEMQYQYGMLKRCRVEVADSRLGGNGQLAPLPEVDQMKTPERVEEKFGQNKDGQLQFVKKQDFLEKVKVERKYNEDLVSTIKLLKQQKDKCEFQMGQARVKFGLPATRYEGYAAYSKEGNIKRIIRENENSLDDAFRISKKQRDLASEPAISESESESSEE